MTILTNRLNKSFGSCGKSLMMCPLSEVCPLRMRFCQNIARADVVALTSSEDLQRSWSSPGVADDVSTKLLSAFTDCVALFRSGWTRDWTLIWVRWGCIILSLTDFGRSRPVRLCTWINRNLKTYIKGSFCSNYKAWGNILIRSKSYRKPLVYRNLTGDFIQRKFNAVDSKISVVDNCIYNIT